MLRAIRIELSKQGTVKFTSLNTFASSPLTLNAAYRVSRNDLATAEKQPLRCLHFTHSPRWHHSNVSERSRSDGRLSLQFTPANQWAAGAQWGNGVGNAHLCLHQQNNKALGFFVVVVVVQGSQSVFYFFIFCSMLADWQLEHLQGFDGHETLPSWIIRTNNRQRQWRAARPWDIAQSLRGSPHLVLPSIPGDFNTSGQV